MAKQPYTVLTSVSDGQLYQAGDTYSCTPEAAAPLIALGALEAVPQLTEPATEPKPLLDLINHSPTEDLVKLKYIGEATADKLIAARPFASLEAAKAATGLADSKWAEITPPEPSSADEEE